MVEKKTSLSRHFTKLSVNWQPKRNASINFCKGKPASNIWEDMQCSSNIFCSRETNRFTIIPEMYQNRTMICIIISLNLSNLLVIYKRDYLFQILDKLNLTSNHLFYVTNKLMAQRKIMSQKMLKLYLSMIMIWILIANIQTQIIPTQVLYSELKLLQKGKLPVVSKNITLFTFYK